MFSSPLLPQGFLIVDESGNSRGDVHHNIAGPLFSCLGSFFSSIFSSSHHEPVSYHPIASYYPGPSSLYHPVLSSSHPVHLSHPSQPSSLSPKSEKSREELDRREEFP